MKKLVSLILVLLMLVPLVVACTPSDDENNGNNNQETTAPVTSAGTPVKDTTAEDKDPYEKDDLPDDLDFGEKKIKIFYWSDRQFQEFESEGPNGNNVNDAIYTRNEKVQKRLNDEFVFFSQKGNSENYREFIKTVENDISGDREYDVIAGYSGANAIMAQRGYFEDLMTYDNILNFSKPWWPEEMVNEATVDSRLFFATGDISTNLLYMMQCIYFNKNMIRQYGLESPYELVTNHTWTIDKLIQMAEGRYEDTGSDGLKTDDDIYGITISSTSNAYDTLFYSCGLTTMEKDADDLPVISPKWNSEKTQNVLNKVLKLFYSDDCYHKVGVKPVFLPGNCLFLISSLNAAAHSLADADFFGIVPGPLYDRYQEDYVTQISGPHTLYSILATSSQKEHAATFLEAMASESYRTVTPEVFAVALQSKYVSDEESSQMLDILKRTINFDAGHVYSFALSNIPNNVWRNCISNNKTSFSGEYASNEVTLNAKLKELINDLTK